MAPSKKEEKEAKLSPEQSAALILDYLRKQNRPYSATDISANLKNRVTKTAAAKILKDLHERKEIDGRAAGKQIVYHAVQEEAASCNADSLRSLTDEISTLRDTITALKAEERSLQTTLRQTETIIPASDLRTQISALQTEKDQIQTRLGDLRSGKVKAISRDESNLVIREWRVMKKSMEARKAIRRELWAEIKGMLPAEAIEETKEELDLQI